MHTGGSIRITTHRYRYLATVGTALLLMAGHTAAVPPDSARYKLIKTSDLITHPKQYWSTGIMFNDTLLGHPSGRTLRMSGKNYTPFRTKKVGICYAAPGAVQEITAAEVERPYVFRGTVLAHKRRFVVVVEKILPAVAEDKISENLLKGIRRSSVRATIAHVVAAAQADLYSFAREQGVSLSTLLAPDSQYLPRVMDIIGSALISAQREEETSSSEILERLVLDLLRHEYHGTPRSAGGTPSSSLHISLKPGLPRLKTAADHGSNPSRPASSAPAASPRKDTKGAGPTPPLSYQLPADP